MYEIHDPADLGDPSISLTEDPNDPGDLPEELLTEEDKQARAAEEQARRDEAAAKKAQETEDVIGKFKGLLDVLQEAPARPAAAPAEAAPQLPPQPTQEQINEWNDKLREMQVTNPLQYAAMMREGTVQEAMQRIISQSGGVIASSAKGFVREFKADKKGESRFYEQIVKKFDEEMSDLNPQAILQMSDEQRSREFSRRWNAAAGDFYEKNTKPVQTLATSASRGTSMAPSSGARNNRPRVVELTDGEKMALVRAMGKDKAKAEIARIEYGL